MPRDITVTLDDGTTHVYKGAPDDVTPEQVSQRAQSEFGKTVTHLDGGRSPVKIAEPTFMQKVHNAVFAPDGERDPSLGKAIVEGIKGIPGQIADDFMAGAHAVGENAPEMVNTGETDIGKLSRAAVSTAGGIAGMAFSPITGTATSLLGRPVEQQTGIKRDITGNVVSALVPLSGEGKAAQAVTKSSRAINPVAMEAHDAGYVLPPKMISEKPGVVADAMAGWSGKIKTAQAASQKNQEATNTLAVKALGLKDGTDLTTKVFETLRSDAGKAYKAVGDAIPTVQSDQNYLDEIAGLGGTSAEAAQAFPNITKNKGIIDLQDELESVRQFSTKAGLEIVKTLRKNGSKNLNSFDDPSKEALGYAQRRAADAIDDLIERNVTAAGNPELVKQYQAARQLIAKSYDVENATNPATGNVNAAAIGRLATKGKPLSGELQTIANVANAFPKAVQMPEKFGGVEPISVLDVGASTLAAVHGNPGVGAALLTRPFARSAVLSDTMQNSLFSQGKNGLQGMTLEQMRRAPAANALYQLAQPNNQGN